MRRVFWLIAALAALSIVSTAAARLPDMHHQRVPVIRIHRDPPQPANLDTVSLMLSSLSRSPVLVPSTDTTTKRFLLIIAGPSNNPPTLLSLTQQQLIKDQVSTANGTLNMSAGYPATGTDLKFEQKGSERGIHADLATLPNPDSFYTTYDSIKSALIAKGYTTPYKKYLVYWIGNATNNVACGQALVDFDQQPGAANRNNNGGDFAIVYNTSGAIRGCSTPETMLHEMGHIMGAVQPTFQGVGPPHESGGNHCWDEYDIMCYADDPATNYTLTFNGHTMVFNCPNDGPAFSEHEVFDCGHDDYFSRGTAAGSYLPTHWNVKNSLYVVNW